MYNFKEIEEEAGKILSKKDVRKAVSDDKSRKKLFSFLEGPPTANAPPGLHHLEVRTFKDIINKFRYMQGFNVPRKAGWDCHGLPVEVQIEKKLKLNSKKDILKFGEAKFIKECKESVFSYIKDWDKSTEKLGYWIDLENPYRTLDNSYVESIWWSLKQLYGKNLLYESHKVVPFCPRCETPLSSHEVALGYKDVTETSIYVKFELEDEPGTYLLAWTTTPWTLPGNSALYVGKDFEYVKIKPKNKNEYYILAKKRLPIINEEYKIIEKVKSEQLVGKKYKPLFDYFNDLDKKYYHIDYADFVELEQGTGLVHSAIMYGEVDFERAKEQGLKLHHILGENGKFLDSVKLVKGLFYKDADPIIIEDLRKRGRLYATEKITHAYPFCWRCDTPLMYYAIKSWFIKVTAYKKRLIELNEKINWTPKHIREGRFGQWLNEVKDWALSRKKFWGTPLPIWRCSCGEEVIIEGVDELKKKSLKKISEKEIDLHKPWIDSVKLKCKCGKEMSRVEDVIDCWYDSGSAIFAQFHYPFENKEEFKRRFPYDFIAEAIDQTRGWFYTLHVLGTILFDDVAYRNVICAGHIVDENGEKMSKTKGNILNSNEVIDAVGVDATRLQFCTVDIGDSKRFGINMVKQDILPFLNILWNTFQYYNQLVNPEQAEERMEDKWILSRLNSVIKEATDNLEKYQIERALRSVMDFISNDFSRTYIKIVREREDKNVKNVVGEILDKISRTLAPYAPNITEVVHKEFGKESVHLASWPKVDEKKINKKLEEEFEFVLKVLEAGLAARDKAGIGLKWPLAKAVVFCDKKIGKELEEIILRQLNVKKIELKNRNELKVELDLKMNKELEAEGYAREIIRKIQALRKEAGLKKENKIELAIKVSRNFIPVMKQQERYIKEKTNAKNIIIDDKVAGKYPYSKIEKVKKEEIHIMLIALTG